jgi:hypothetical protein
MKLKSLVFATVAAVALTWTAWAHHAHSNYDTNSFTNLEGTVKQLRWMNPHTWIYMEVTDQGKPVVWTLEGGSPNALVREGWKKEDIKVGETIKVRCHRLKDGANGCLLGFVTTSTIPDKEFD